MKLSEAIREGSKGQAHGTAMYFNEDGACCALGAALRTLGFEAGSEQEVYLRGELEKAWPEVDSPVARSSSGFSVSLWEKVVELNDLQERTFNEIADAVEALGY